tara:strand:- start:1596 stop:2270 length:675 start_codon:yes stop_codon:yes gene_type:complete
MNKLKNPVILFPLPNTVFYPNTQLSLHIFEPRYRKMVEDAVDSDLLIGMVLLKVGWDKDYFGQPPVEKIGCAGKISALERLAEGKFNIVLEGLSRFRILEEYGEKPYRLATVDFLELINDHPLQADYAAVVRNLITQYEDLLERTPQNKRTQPRPNFHACETVSQAVDQIAHSLDWNIKKKQAFLEERNVQNRLVQIRSEVELRYQILHLSSVLKKSNADSGLN